MSYYFFLGTIPVPIPPKSLNIKTPSKNETVTLISGKEINILKEKGLKEISFEILLPQVNKYPFANYNLGNYTATAFITALKLWDETKKPFPFIVSRMTPDNKILFFTSMLVSLEDYELIEDADNGLDVVCSLNLKEYAFQGTETLKQIATKVVGGLTSVATTVISKTRDTSTKVENKTYIVKKGDTLWSIAKREFGDGQKYKDIAKLNNLANPNLIKIGQQLRLR